MAKWKKPSEAARACISREIKKHYKKGKPKGQAAAIAYSICERKGFHSIKRRSSSQLRGPTIYEALRRKLGREPKNTEIKAEVDRIKREAYESVATRGGLPHQRVRRRKSQR